MFTFVILSLAYCLPATVYLSNGILFCHSRRIEIFQKLCVGRLQCTTLPTNTIRMKRTREIFLDMLENQWPCLYIQLCGEFTHTKNHTIIWKIGRKKRQGGRQQANGGAIIVQLTKRRTAIKFGCSCANQMHVHYSLLMRAKQWRFAFKSLWAICCSIKINESKIDIALVKPWSLHC